MLRTSWIFLELWALTSSPAWHLSLGYNLLKSVCSLWTSTVFLLLTNYIYFFILYSLPPGNLRLWWVDFWVHFHSLINVLSPTQSRRISFSFSFFFLLSRLRPSLLERQASRLLWWTDPHWTTRTWWVSRPDSTADMFEDFFNLTASSWLWALNNIHLMMRSLLQLFCCRRIETRNKKYESDIKAVRGCNYTFDFNFYFFFFFIPSFLTRRSLSALSHGQLSPFM